MPATVADVDAAYYHQKALGGFPQTVRRVRKGLQPKAAEFDAIVMRGVSGQLIGLPVAYLLGKTPIIVRRRDEVFKEGNFDNPDVSHSNRLVEGGQTHEPFRYLVLDDQISSGTTMQRIEEAMFKFRPNGVCIGIAIYNGSGWKPGRVYQDVEVFTV